MSDNGEEEILDITFSSLSDSARLDRIWLAFQLTKWFWLKSERLRNIPICFISVLLNYRSTLTAHCSLVPYDLHAGLVSSSWLMRQGGEEID